MISKKKKSLLGVWAVAALITVPVATMALGGYWGWKSSYNALGVALALHSAEKGAEIGLIVGAVLDFALVVTAEEALKSGRRILSRFRKSPNTHQL